MLKSSFCDYSDAYALIKWTITVANTVATVSTTNDNNKEVNSTWNETNSTQVNNVKGIDAAMPMHNLNNITIIVQKLLNIRYYRDKTVANDAGVIVDFTNNGDSNSFNFKEKIIGQTASIGTADVKIMVPLK